MNDLLAFWGFVYLASPYSHEDAAVRSFRHDAVCRLAGRLIDRGVLAFSPIAHSHPIAIRQDLPAGWEFWERVDMALLDRCDGLAVVTLPGWRESVGVRAEVMRAAANGKPLWRIDYNPDTGFLAATHCETAAELMEMDKEGAK